MDHLKRTSTRTRLPMLSRPVFLRLEEDAELVCCSSRKVGRLQRLSFKRSKNGQIACGEKTATESREGPFAGLNLQNVHDCFCMLAEAANPARQIHFLPVLPSYKLQNVSTLAPVALPLLAVIHLDSLADHGGSMSLPKNGLKTRLRQVGFRRPCMFTQI